MIGWRYCRLNAQLVNWPFPSDHQDIKHSPIFDPNPVYGLGAFPGPESGYNLTTGAFKDIRLAYPSSHPIQRNYTLQVGTRDPTSVVAL
jgi:hypothetical protein